MIRNVPVIASFSDPMGCGLPILVKVTCEGLRALGLHPFAEPLGRRATPSAVKEALDAVQAAEWALDAAGAEGWAGLADNVRRHLRAMELRVQRRAG